MFDMLWIYDPSAWLGLLTLVVLEIVLGIDNLVFIAILAGKLPLKVQDKARYMGLGLALLIRLVMLTFISWIVSLKEPLFTIGDFGFSLRDLILLLGGVFLLYKSTSELHEKLEGKDHSPTESKATSHAFWLVVMQIVVLDAVFSLDSVITAVGMCEHVFIMMFAVIIAMFIMVVSSKPLTIFVTSHPTLVILCLSFLLMIGFSLLAEGLHIHVPKAYLYAAIGFSILIEIFNQIARKNSLKLDKNLKNNSRELAASLVLRILGSRNEGQFQSIKESIVAPPSEKHTFSDEEKDLVSRALQLNGQPLRAIMTARRDVEMLDVGETKEEVLAQLTKTKHSILVAIKDGNRDAPLGYIKKSEVLAKYLAGEDDDLGSLVRAPMYIPETVSVLKAIEECRSAKNYVLFVVDEFANYEGLVTLHDMLEEIAGDLPERSEKGDCVEQEDGSFLVIGEIALNELARQTGFSAPQSVHYHTLAGYIVETMQTVPQNGMTLEVQGWRIKIEQVDGHSVALARLIPEVKSQKDDE